MKFFIDTADIKEISELISTGLVDGITTNPSLIAKQGKGMKEIIGSICEIVKGPVSAEVTATDYSNMVKEGEYLASIAKNIAIKVPLTQDGLKTCRTLSNKGFMVNVTLCFSAAQAVLAAKSGATFISPFIGRLDDIGHTGMDLIREIKQIFSNYDFKTQILVASVRHPQHVVDAAKVGADVVTLPASVLGKMLGHSLTDKGLKAFLSDWEKLQSELSNKE